jgi:hypothetical protein
MRSNSFIRSDQAKPAWELLIAVLNSAALEKKHKLPEL